jgi:hypothetical protein
LTISNLGRLEFDLNNKPIVTLGISTDGTLLTIECTPEPKTPENTSARPSVPKDPDPCSIGILPAELTDKDRFMLFNVLTTYYNLEDIRTSAFKLGIGYDELAGATIQAKAMSLIEYCFKHRMLKKLFDQVREERSELFK